MVFWINVAEFAWSEEKLGCSMPSILGLRWWSLGHRKVAKKIENNEIFLRSIGFTEKCCLISLVRDTGQLLRALKIVLGWCPRSCLDTLYVDWWLCREPNPACGRTTLATASSKAKNQTIPEQYMVCKIKTFFWIKLNSISLRLFKYFYLLWDWKFSILLHRLACLRHLLKQKISEWFFCFSSSFFCLLGVQPPKKTVLLNGF